MDHAELVAAARKGDGDAFAELIGRYEERILRLVRGMVPVDEVEDVAQEAFLKAYRKLHLFDGRSSFFTWIYRLTMNTAMDWRKKQDRRRHAALPRGPSGETLVVGRELRPDRAAHSAELGAIIDREIADLPPKYHEILVLREVQDLSYDDIATTLGISRGTVESRLFRARERLRARLRPHLETS